MVLRVILPPTHIGPGSKLYAAAVKTPDGLVGLEAYTAVLATMSGVGQSQQQSQLQQLFAIFDTNKVGAGWARGAPGMNQVGAELPPLMADRPLPPNKFKLQAHSLPLDK